MKFLIALSLLVSTAAFANERGHYIKCYDTAQGDNMEVVYKFKAAYDWIKLIKPVHQPLRLDEQDNCLEYPILNSETELQPTYRFCLEDGQRVNGLIPVEAEYGQEEETVYCERKILKYFNDEQSMY